MNFDCKTSDITWRRTSSKEYFRERFQDEDWHRIFVDFKSDNDCSPYLTQYKDIVQSYTLYDNKSQQSIALIWLILEEVNKHIISIHGGGWDKSVRLSFLYYRGLIVMIDHLLKQGFKVRTSCLIANERAFRFLRSVGFVKYYSTDTKHLMWINAKRLESSSIYKRIMQ